MNRVLAHATLPSGPIASPLFFLSAQCVIFLAIPPPLPSLLPLLEVKILEFHILNLKDLCKQRKHALQGLWPGVLRQPHKRLRNSLHTPASCRDCECTSLIYPEGSQEVKLEGVRYCK